LKGGERERSHHLGAGEGGAWEEARLIQTTREGKLLEGEMKGNTGERKIVNRLGSKKGRNEKAGGHAAHPQPQNKGTDEGCPKNN